MEKVTFVYKRNKLNYNRMTVLNISAAVRIGSSHQSVHVTGESCVRNTSVYTTTCALQRDGHTFLAVDRSGTDRDSFLTRAVMYLLRNTSFGVSSVLRAALCNDFTSLLNPTQLSIQRISGHSTLG